MFDLLRFNLCLLAQNAKILRRGLLLRKTANHSLCLPSFSNRKPRPDSYAATARVAALYTQKIAVDKRESIVPAVRE